jgi:predicted kinase
VSRHLIVGSPCSGKSTYAMAMARENPGLVLIDMDLTLQSIAPSVGQREYPEAAVHLARIARRSILREALTQGIGFILVDNLLSDPAPTLRRWLYTHRAEVTWVTTPRPVCEWRAREGRASWTLDLIDRWNRETFPILERHTDRLGIVDGDTK